MLEVDALQFSYTFKTYDSFRSEEKDILLNKYSALLGVSTSDEFENVYKETYDYVMQTIYNYYDCYYLTSPTKDRFLTLLGTILSGKLPNYKVKYDNYLDARNQTYNTLGGRKTSSSGSGSGSSSGGQKFANTPEVINSGVDYVDEYSTSENKYNNSRSDNYRREYDETLTASAKQLWENVKSIPDDIYKEVITITAKLFFSETMEERQYPCAYLTLTRRVQELGSSVITSLEQKLNTDYELVTTLTTEGKTFETSTDFKHAILKELKTTYDDELHAVQTKWIYRDGFEGVDTYTIPMSSLTNSGLMSSDQFSKLDQVVLYGTNFASQGEQYAVRQDADHDLYVVVPKGEVAIASKDETGVVQLYANQLTIPVETTLYTSDLKVPVQMDSRNKLFVEVPNYILPEATTTAYGGIKLFNERKSSEITTTTHDTGENLPVELDINGRAFVNNGMEQVVKLYDGESFIPTFENTITYTLKTGDVGKTIKIPLEGITFEKMVDPNINLFKVTKYITQRLTFNRVSANNADFIYTSDEKSYELTDDYYKWTASSGNLYINSNNNGIIYDIILYLDFNNSNNSYISFTIGSYLSSTDKTLTFSILSNYNTAPGSISKIFLDTYTGYTSYIVINGKAYYLGYNE